MVFFHALEGILSILFMVALGYYLTAKGWFDQSNSKIIPKLVTTVALPAYMLWNLTSTFDHDKLLAILYGAAVPFASMSLCCLLGHIASRLLHVPPNRAGIFRTVFFCSNSVFIGIPVNLALFGDSSTPYVLLYYLANTTFFWTFGNYFISQDGSMSDISLFSRQSLKNIFSPPFIGFITATIFVVLDVHLPDVIVNTAKYLGNMTTPLSLIFVGIAMFGVNIRNIQLDKELLVILLGRFIISPLLVLLVCTWFPIPPLMKKVFVIQAALPAMTQVTILAKVYEADMRYAAILTTLTTLVAILAIPFYMVVI